MRNWFWITTIIVATGCSHLALKPQNAVAEADADIRAHKIRIYFVGGRVPTAPGISPDVAAPYPRRYAGGPGCDDSNEADCEYARRYNERIADYLHKQ